MGDVGLPLRGNSHVCRMGGRYHDGHDGDGGDDDGDDGDGSGDVDEGGGGNGKVTYIHSCNGCDKYNSTSQNWNYLDSVYFVVTSLLKANIDLQNNNHSLFLIILIRLVWVTMCLAVLSEMGKCTTPNFTSTILIYYVSEHGISEIHQIIAR